jgi:predicted enzyme related to lactoylglutathione lyase
MANGGPFGSLAGLRVIGRAALGATLLLAAMALLVGCAGQPRWPAVTATPSNEHMPGRWVWVDLVTADVAQARRFYGAVFDWSFETHGRGAKAYTLVRNDGVPVAGMLHAAAVGDASAPAATWVGLVSVDDVWHAARAAEKRGGALLVPPTELPGRGLVALLADPEGARFGLLDSSAGDPPDLFPGPGEFIWRELWSRDTDAMAAFYVEVTSAQAQPAAGHAPVEWHLAVAGYPRAGIVYTQVDALPAAWLQYVRVADLDDALARVRANGGSVLLAPGPQARAGTVAIIADPQGAPLGLVQWRAAHDAGETPP